MRASRIGSFEPDESSLDLNRIASSGARICLGKQRVCIGQAEVARTRETGESILGLEREFGRAVTQAPAHVEPTRLAC